jgi:hypothetical protein
MDIQYVVFRYEPDLRQDGWIPLGVVAERRIDATQTQASVVCMRNLDTGETDEFAGAILRNIGDFLRLGVQESRGELLPQQDLLERLRDKHKWNFHFSVPQELTVDHDELLRAAYDLFGTEVLQKLSLRGLVSPSRGKETIRPQEVEVYDVAV